MIAPRIEARAGRVIEFLARLVAYSGGLILLAISAMTVVSIIGRMGVGYGLGPVPGDYELVANGCALAVFSFLPYCQLKRGHVTVDILTDHFPARVRVFMGLLGDVLISLGALVILRQLWFGFAEKFPYGSDALREALSMGYKPFYPETTYELQIPVWIPYGFALLGAALFALVALYTVWRSLNWLSAGQEDAV
ncbi:MAG: TRAP transporter small permease [Rhodobacteraceae bacterium]|nr:TRAP transporter small permease [Paracoccaceae bacterium]